MCVFVGGGELTEGMRGFKVSHQFVAVLFLKEANPTAT